MAPQPLCQYVHACEKIATAPQDDRSWPHPNPLARQGESIKTGIGDRREEMDFNYSEEAEAFRHELRAWLEKNAPHNATLPLDGITEVAKTTGTGVSDGIGSSRRADGP